MVKAFLFGDIGSAEKTIQIKCEEYIEKESVLSYQCSNLTKASMAFRAAETEVEKYQRLLVPNQAHKHQARSSL